MVCFECERRRGLATAARPPPTTENAPRLDFFETLDQEELNNPGPMAEDEAVGDGEDRMLAEDDVVDRGEVADAGDEPPMEIPRPLTILNMSSRNSQMPLSLFKLS
jgi:hypothetical protein